MGAGKYHIKTAEERIAELTAVLDNLPEHQATEGRSSMRERMQIRLDEVMDDPQGWEDRERERVSALYAAGLSSDMQEIINDTD